MDIIKELWQGNVAPFEQCTRGDMNELLEMYRLLLIKNSLIDGVVDEDMYQELCYKFITAVYKFKF